ncbi:toxin syme type i toxin-antitoxin system [Lucifera butyrica]|uniref:Toxin syme type i toxin-antitoxin system n=1 Tax=Lucifera butyrica TaxID=1351585 RepID=A0A498RAY8_9FIRM|nr:SymE family type I addiction module toxin [Lucifera butyrica]VBB08644.1 toxin syme type i toxin-antitoxin system [Lucifera butyrica]
MISKVDKILAVHNIIQDQKRIPIIRLQGKWLYKLGFSLDDKVSVVGEEGNISIKLINTRLDNIAEK